MPPFFIYFLKTFAPARRLTRGGGYFTGDCLYCIVIMQKPEKDLRKNIQKLKELLPAEDILTFAFSLPSGRECTAIFTDGVTDKELLGEQVAKPLGEYTGEETFEGIIRAVAAPENKEGGDFASLTEEILDGNAVLFVDGFDRSLIVGVKTVPARAVMEPPTDIAIKGPRAGFVEDVKTNMSLLRTRIKTPELLFKTVTIGRRSRTKVVLCYLKNIARDEVVRNIESRLKRIDIDGVPDSSYVALFLAGRRHSLFKQTGTTEKPDILAAKMLEGRVGILVDGSPIALTLPYLLIEDFQASEDYFVSPFRASFTRFIRIFSLIISIYLPAFYVSAQLFKLQLLPLGLLLTIASNIQGLPLSPSLEMFLTVLLLEVLTEASVRMPKYVGMALSVVGALVLGDTAVNAGILSTPAILIIALSGICLYTVPNLIETTSLIRLLMLLAAGSVGIYGIVLLTAFLLYYLFSSESYGAPLLAPFSPMIENDLRDAFTKYNLRELRDRPVPIRGNNKRRLRDDEE